MNRNLMLALMGLAILLNGCMKKSTTSKFKGDVQSLMSSKYDQTNICRDGALLKIEPVGATPPVFETGQAIWFKISALGRPCEYGYQIMSGADSGRTFSATTYVSRRIDTPTPVRIEEFSIGVRDATRQVIQSFDYESEPFEVKLAALPSCTVSPETVYLSSTLGTQTQGEVFVNVSFGQRGQLIDVTSNEAGFVVTKPSPLPSPIQDAHSTLYGVRTLTNSKNGSLQFTVKDTQRNINGSCSVSVVASDCDRSISGLFTEGSTSSWWSWSGDQPRLYLDDYFRLNCQNKEMWVNGRAGSYFFGKLSGALPLLTLAANVDADEFTELVLVGKDSAGNGKFTILNSSGGANGSYTFSERTCSGEWPAARMPNSFVVSQTNGVVKIRGTHQGVIYESVLSLSGDTCSVGTTSSSPAAVVLDVIPSEVDWKQPFNLMWSAENVAGYSCHLKRCADAACSTSTALEQNLQGNAIVRHTYQVSGIENDTTYEAGCIKSGVDPVISRITARIRAGSGPYLFAFKPGASESERVASFDPFEVAIPSAGQEQSVAVNLKWGNPSASCSLSGTSQCCSIVSKPVGAAVTTDAVAPFGYGTKNLTATTEFSFTCPGLTSIPPYTVYRLGSLRIAPSTQAAAVFSNQDPSVSRSTTLLVQAHPQGLKVKVESLKIVDDAFNVVHAGHLSVSGCVGQVLDPGQTCSATVTYSSGGHNHAVSGKLGVEYKRYDAAGVLSASAPLQKMKITSVSGQTRNRICDQKGRNCR